MRTVYQTLHPQHYVGSRPASRGIIRSYIFALAGSASAQVPPYVVSRLRGSYPPGEGARYPEKLDVMHVSGNQDPGSRLYPQEDRLWPQMSCFR